MKDMGAQQPALGRVAYDEYSLTMRKSKRLRDRYTPFICHFATGASHGGLQCIRGGPGRCRRQQPLSAVRSR